MENRKRLYIVSFGDSRQYRVLFESDTQEYPLRHSDPEPLVKAERAIETYLKKRFPGESLAYYTTPRVSEIDWSHRDRYDSYPLLDDKAVAEIEKVLSKEIENEQYQASIDSNAPFSDHIAR